MQNNLKGYKLLGLDFVGNGYYRCEKDRDLYLINSETFKPLFEEPTEAILLNLNGPEFVVKKNGLSAVFDMDGMQLTDFVQGFFCWKWTEPDEKGFDLNCMKRTIYNKEAKIELPPR